MLGACLVWVGALWVLLSARPAPDNPVATG
jgi:hypothetical protein